MKKVIVFISIVSFLTLTFVACNSDNINRESTIRNFITAYYSVNQSDYDYYQKMRNGAKESEVQDSIKSYETNTKKFQQYLSDKSYQSFYAERLSNMRIGDAYKNNIFVEIKDLKISKAGEDKKKKTIDYRYELQLNQINKDTKKVEIVKETSTFTVIKENGHWKILDRIVLE